MPLYEYECTACHRLTEKIQKFSDPELTVCPHCGGPLQRTITAAAVLFKGGGWYKDGYTSAKRMAPGESAGGSGTGGGDAGNGGSASKVDAVAAPASSGDGAKPSKSPQPAPSAPTAPAAPSSAKP